MNAGAPRCVAAVGRITCLPVLLCLSACVQQGNRPSSAPVTPSVPVQAPAPPASASQPAAGQPAVPPDNTPAAAQALPAQPSGAANSRSSGSPPKSPSATPRSPTPSHPAQASASPPALAGPPALDLKALEQRLRDTSAIGVFTKLTLKNQVDDLLAQFKAFHQGQSQLTLAQLRQKYEELLLKVVSLLQDGDPALASAISASREAIWNVLTDPKKFANI